jgi:hypothetical protein
MRSQRVIVGLVVLGLPVLASAGTLTLSWKAGDGGMAEGYVIERQSGATQTYTALARTPLLTYVDTDVPSHAPICYVVKAYNGLFTSGPSNEVCINMPAAPMDFTITSTGPLPGEAPATLNVKARRQKR